LIIMVGIVNALHCLQKKQTTTTTTTISLTFLGTGIIKKQQ